MEPAPDTAEHDRSDDDPVVVEITEVIDLHTFIPSEVGDVVRDYLDEAYARGFREVRIIHGRGAGVQRRSVRALLDRDPRVIAYRSAPSEDGGHGATLVSLE